MDSLADPSIYIKPDAGFLFRFPFPDEDKFVLGDIGNFPFDRKLPVTINFNEIAALHNNEPIPEADAVQFEIVRQKLVHREEDGKLILALIVREPVSGEIFRIENDKDIENFVRQLYRNYVMNEPDNDRKTFYREISLRILKVYRGKIPQVQVLQQNKPANIKSIRKSKGIR